VPSLLNAHIRPCCAPTTTIAAAVGPSVAFLRDAFRDGPCADSSREDFAGVFFLFISIGVSTSRVRVVRDPKANPEEEPGPLTAISRRELACDFYHRLFLFFILRVANSASDEKNSVVF